MESLVFGEYYAYKGHFMHSIDAHYDNNVNNWTTEDTHYFHNVYDFQSKITHYFHNMYFFFQFWRS